MGLSLARELAGLGERVTVLERHPPGARGAGAASPAALGLLVHPGYRDSPFGRLLRVACEHYQTFCRELQDETGIDPGYRVPGGLYLARQRPRDRTRQRARRSYGRAGVEARWLDRAQIEAMVEGLSETLITALHLPGEALVDPPSLLRALMESCRRRGVAVETTACDVKLALDGPARLDAGTGAVLSASTVIAAIGAWTPALLGAAFASAVPVAPVRGQALELALDLGGSPVLHFEVTGRERSYYILPKGGGTAWVGSTVEEVGYDVGTSPEGVAELEEAVAEVFPGARPEVLRAWSGLRPRAGRRGGPFLGPLPGREDVWVACGHYKNGIVLGPVSARLLAKQLLGKPITRVEDGFDEEELRVFWP